MGGMGAFRSDNDFFRQHGFSSARRGKPLCPPLRACHPHGGNKINPAIPLIGSSKTKSLAVFTAYNRNPLKADGSKGVMPAFPKDKISDQEMKLIYDYCLTLTGTGK